jgi:hypothetical protein
MALIYKIKHDTPVRAFLIEALITAIIIASAFAINEYLDHKFKKFYLNKRIGFKVGFHFLQAFIITFITFGLFFLLFGIGSNKFPLCSVAKHCK